MFGNICGGHSHVSAATNEARMRELIQQLERAGAAGSAGDVVRLLKQAELLAPEHPMVLNAAAVQKLNAGDAAAAKVLLERAISKDDKNPAFWINLASTYRNLQQPDAEMNAIEQALKLEPRYLIALLQKASLLELQGKQRAAAKVYQNALQILSPGAKLPPFLKGQIDRAIEAVRADQTALESFLNEKLLAVRVAHSGEKQNRFEHSIDALLGKRAIYRPQPTLMYFPKIPAWEFHDRDAFAWLDEIEAATVDIRAEFERVFVEDAKDLEPYIAYPDGVPLDQWSELNRSRRWSAFYLWREGQPNKQHLARCPITAAILAKAPQVHVPEHGPTAFFSILDAKTRIPPHTGVTNTRLVVHLPLVIPPGCGFRVGSETREWQLGRAWVFDDTIEHEAWNNGEMPRAILIFDIWNPYLTAAERDLVRAAVEGISVYYREEAPLSGLI